MVSQNLKKCLNELKLLSSIKDKRARTIVLKKLAKKDCIYRALREIAVNLQNRNIPLTTPLKRHLNKHIKSIKALAVGSKVKSRREKLSRQFGGIIPLAALIPMIASIAGAATSKLVDKL
jgi:hypothetical protein